MSLTDIMSHADLSLYPKVSLVLFLIVFGAVAWRVSRRDSADDDHDASIPLRGADRSAGAEL